MYIRTHVCMYIEREREREEWTCLPVASLEINIQNFGHTYPKRTDVRTPSRTECAYPKFDLRIQNYIMWIPISKSSLGFDDFLLCFLIRAIMRPYPKVKSLRIQKCGQPKLARIQNSINNSQVYPKLY